MKQSELEKIVTIKNLRKLNQNGLLNDDAFAETKKMLRPADFWFDKAKQVLLPFGCGLVLAGIIFFFAYNWAVLGRFYKLAIIETAIVICSVLSYFVGLRRIGGKLLILSASVLVGVLLAVYGQIYQTGADAFELFLGWAILIFGWVLISKFDALWFVWLIILNTGGILFWHQVGKPAYLIRQEFFWHGLAFINILVLLLREFNFNRGAEWLKNNWSRDILVSTILFSFSFPLLLFIIDFKYVKGITYLSMLIWLIVIAIGFLWYRFRLRQIIPIALILTDVCVVLLVFIGKILFVRNYDVTMFFWFGLIILGAVTGMVFLLEAIAKTINLENENE